MILPVIMAGESGSRLWPLSRQQFPKQFLTLHGENSMLQATALRLSGLEHQAPMVICNEEHRFSVAEQFRANDIANSGIILEPVGRNTAPAIALAAFNALKEGNDPLLLVLAADHVIKDEIAFWQSVNQASAHANVDKLVTFGIVPTTPETGYGYIKRGDPVDSDELRDSSQNSYKVDKFVEKPDSKTADSYVDSGDYYWNSGMFLFKASRYLEELRSFRPDIYQACEKAMSDIQSDADFIRVNKDAFESCPEESVDYAVMEKTLDAVVVPMDCGWGDVGSWSALWEIENKDNNGNVFRGDILNIDTTNSYINAKDKLVAIIGLDDVVVVETKDAILVSKKSDVTKSKRHC